MDTGLRIVETARGPVEAGVLGEGAPVLVVHGTPGGADQALAMGGFLADAGFQVIAPSRPGYLGTRLSSGPSIDDQADLHAALLDALGHDTAGVLAWSGGGPSAYRLAVRHPGRVRALVAAAAVSSAFAPKAPLEERVMLDTSAGNWVLRFLARHAPGATVKSTLQAEGDLSRHELRDLTQQALGDERLTDLVLTMAAAAADHAHRHEGIDNDRAAFGAIEDLELGRITAPVLLIHGTADADVPPSQTDQAEAALGGAERIALERGTHLALWVHPDAVAAQARAIAVLGA